MTIPVFPGKIGAPMRRWLADSVSATQSPFTLSEQVQDWGGRQWQFEAPVAITRGREARAVAGFGAGVGRAGPFVLLDPSVRDVGNVGAPEVTAGGQTGHTLHTAGWSQAPDQRNMLPNSTMQGAAVGVLGAGGSLPDGWSTFGIDASAVEVVSVAPEDGRPTIRLRINGTPTASFWVRPGRVGDITNPVGQVWAASFWAQIVGGNLTNVDALWAWFLGRAGGTSTEGSYSEFTGPAGDPLRRSVTRTLSSAATDAVETMVRFLWTSGAVDFTLKIQAPQLERAAAPTDFQPTPQAVLYSGDLFSLGSGATKRLYMLTEDFVPDADGAGTLRFSPPLRSPSIASDALDVVTPGCVCRLTSPLPADIGRADLHRFTLNCREAL